MLTNSERRVLVFIIAVFLIGSLAGFLREEPMSKFLEVEESYVSFPVNINTAGKKELVLIPHIGPVTADRILEYRDKNNGFREKSEILKVKGIGEITFKKIEDKICVEYSNEKEANRELH